MSLATLTRDYARMSDDALPLKATAIHDAMLAAISDFPTPDPSLASLKEVNDDYKAALSAAQTHDKIKISIKNDRKKDLIQILDPLRLYVLKIADGDETTLLKSNFTLRKNGLQPAPPITNPQDMQVENGLNPGEVVTSVKAVKGARAYSHEYTPDPLTDNSTWVTATNTRRRNVFTGLDRGKTYWFRVAAIGGNNQVAYSEMISKIVQ